MKKFFTLIAAVAMAASVNAQTESAVIAADASYAGAQVLSTTNAQIVLGGENETFTVKSGGLSSDQPYEAYIAGKNNPKDADGSGYAVEKKNKPVTGCYYVFSAKKNGKVEIGIQLSNGKAFYVLDGETAENSVTKTLIDSSGNTISLDADQKVTQKLYGTVNFEVVANKEYYVFCAGSKLGFYGYQFTPDSATGISSITSSSVKSVATYNLAGQQVSDSYKGIVIKNGKKYVK